MHMIMSVACIACFLAAQFMTLVQRLASTHITFKNSVYHFYTSSKRYDLANEKASIIRLYNNKLVNKILYPATDIWLY